MTPVRILIALLALSAVSTACRMSPEAAREKLAQQNIQFSEVELFKRIEEGDVSVVELFLAAGANANAMTESSFRITDQVVETLKGRSVPDDVLKKMENLMDQQITGEDEFLSVLRSTIGDEPATKFQSVVLQYAKSDNGQTALMAAARKGHRAIVKALLDAKADANGENKVGETALLVAAFNSHNETIKTLLDAKADVNAKDDNGITPLMAAAYKGQTDTMQILMSVGGDINAKDSSGNTVLMHAAEQGYNDAVQALLAQGAGAKARNHRGITALLKAFSSGHTTVVQSLLANIRNENPETGMANASTVAVKAYTFAADGFLNGSIEVPGGKVVLTEGATGEIPVDRIAIMMMEWEHTNVTSYQRGYWIPPDGGHIQFYSHILGVTAQVTPKKLEILLRDGQALVAELERVKPDKLDFITQVDGADIRLELPLKYFEADYMKEESRRRLTLGAPLTRKDKGWKVKHVMIDFT